jgi:hypothetical protein
MIPADAWWLLRLLRRMVGIVDTVPDNRFGEVMHSHIHTQKAEVLIRVVLWLLLDSTSRIGWASR